MNRKAGNTRARVATPQARAAYFERMLKRLCTDAGPHPSGTKAYVKVVKAIHRELADALPVAFLDRYLDLWATVPRPEILHRGKPLEVEVAQNCAGTADAGFTGIIRRVDRQGVRYGIEDVATRQIGALVAVSRDVSAEPEYLLDDGILSLPRFIIGIRDVPLVDLLARGKEQVQVRLRVVYAPVVPTYNAVGTLPGKSTEEILVVAHADSLIQTEGANDNTATAIIHLMLAHAFSGMQPARRLTFLITGSEEYGCPGARHYVRRRQIEGTAGNLRFIVNCDSLTYGPNLLASTTDAGLMKVVQAVHEDLELKTQPIYRETQEPWANDAACFKGINPQLRGINFNSRGYATLAANHTPDDTAENVPRDCAETSFQVLREFIVRLQEL